VYAAQLLFAGIADRGYPKCPLFLGHFIINYSYVVKPLVDNAALHGTQSSLRNTVIAFKTITTTASGLQLEIETLYNWLNSDGIASGCGLPRNPCQIAAE
jgi:hypothetical protein